MTDGDPSTGDTTTRSSSAAPGRSSLPPPDASQAVALNEHSQPPIETDPRPPTGASAASLVDRAKADDKEAIATMFAQFLPPSEQTVDCQYLGVLGFWGIGIHSFAAVTARRVASLRISLLGGTHYSDGALEYVNSASIFQPSKVTLYLYAAVVSLFGFAIGFGVHPAFSIVTLGLTLALLPIIVRFYYRFKKSGLVLWVREGISIYVFIDRKRMRVANAFYRQCNALREERLRLLGHP